MSSANLLYDLFKTYGSSTHKKRSLSKFQQLVVHCDLEKAESSQQWEFSYLSTIGKFALPPSILSYFTLILLYMTSLKTLVKR